MDLSGISVVVPAFNESKAIASVLQRIDAHLATLADRYDVELIVVDDGSTDDTFDVLQTYAAADPSRQLVLRHEQNAGLVAAMRTGAEAARYETVVFLDADLSYAPETIEPLVVARIENGAEAALASPYMAGGSVRNVPPLRRAASRIANRILTWCARGRLHTFTGMVRAYERSAFLGLFETEPEGEFNAWAVAMLYAGGARVVEIPAELAWPPERFRSAPRLSIVALWRRTMLVFRTARVLAFAARCSIASYPRDLRTIPEH